MNRLLLYRLPALAVTVAALAAAPSMADTLPTVPTAISVGFSPDGTAEPLVIRAIDSARSSIRVMAYAFTSPAVARALIAAKRRGVDVDVVVDEKNNLVENRARNAREALNLLVNAGIPTRTVSAYSLQHSKYMVIDSEHVETGSFNYTTSAARYNSENALVIWNRPDLAKEYLANWTTVYNQGQPYTSTY
jgi:phosphatidylserine/phosphatidylglycerophosphate/cardiolipin synthase-like enzyme